MTTKIDDALSILTELGFPRAQLNERSALCLLEMEGTRGKVLTLLEDKGGVFRDPGNGAPVRDHR